ncbi:Protein maternal effect lethal 26 [Halotydeus destructor]|nr:Protein maternal effect lethal 26 [Halotydeus destructor]
MIDYTVLMVRCDGSKLSVNEVYRIPKNVAHEYLHDGNKLVFRYKINILGNILPGNDGLLKLFKSINGPFNDFEILAQGGSVKAMKHILAVKWKYFETKMETDRAEYMKRFWVVEERAHIMKDLVGFVYCDAITIENMDHAIMLVAAGYKYLLDPLLALCATYLVAEVNASNVLRLLVLSDKYSLPVLKEKCLTVIPKFLNGKAMKDFTGYPKYIRYANHARLTEACFENTVRMMQKKRKLADASLE